MKHLLGFFPRSQCQPAHRLDSGYSLPSYFRSLKTIF